MIFKASISKIFGINLRQQNYYYAKFFLAILFSICGTYFNFKVFEPGLFSQDSIYQLSQAFSNEYGDWHPPLMAYLWHLFLSVTLPISSMLFSQICLLWFALFLYRKNQKFSIRSNLIYLLPFLPWIYNFTGVIWKDVLLAYSLLNIAIYLSILFSRKKINYGNFVVVFLLFFVTYNLRGNAIFAIIPFIFLFSFIYLKKFNLFKISLLSIVIILGTLVFSNLFNYSYLKAQKTHPESMIYTDDLLYFSLIANESLIPGANLESLVVCAKTRLAEMTYSVKGMCLDLYTESEVDKSDLTSVWLQTVSQNPMKYVSFRIGVFSEIIRNSQLPPIYIQQIPEIIDNPNDLVFEKNKYYVTMQNVISWTSTNYPNLFKPYLWLSINLSFLTALSVYILKNRRNTRDLIPTFVIALSALMYAMAYLVIGSGPDFRYFYWSVVAINFTFLDLLISKFRFSSFIKILKYGLLALLFILLINFVVNNYKVTSDTFELYT